MALDRVTLKVVVTGWWSLPMSGLFLTEAFADIWEVAKMRLIVDNLPVRGQRRVPRLKGVTRTRPGVSEMRDERVLPQLLWDLSRSQVE